MGSLFLSKTSNIAFTGRVLSEDSLGYLADIEGNTEPQYLLKSCFLAKHRDQTESTPLNIKEVYPGDIIEVSGNPTPKYCAVVGRSKSAILATAAKDITTATTYAAALALGTAPKELPCTVISASEYTFDRYTLKTDSIFTTASKYSDIEHWFILDPAGKLVEVIDPDSIRTLIEERKCAICGEDSTPNHTVTLHHITPKWLSKLDPSYKANEGIFLHWDCAHSDLSAADMAALAKDIQRRVRERLGPEGYKQRMSDLAKKEHAKRKETLGDDGYREDQLSRLRKKRADEILATDIIIKEAQATDPVELAFTTTEHLLKYLWETYSFMLQGYQHFVTPTHADPSRRYTYNEGAFIRSNLTNGSFLFIPQGSVHFEELRKDWEDMVKILKTSYSQIFALSNALKLAASGQRVHWGKSLSIAKSAAKSLLKIQDIVNGMESHLASIPPPANGHSWYVFGFGKEFLMKALDTLLPGAKYLEHAVDMINTATKAHADVTGASGYRSPFTEGNYEQQQQPASRTQENSL